MTHMSLQWKVKFGDLHSPVFVKLYSHCFRPSSACIEPNSGEIAHTVEPEPLFLCIYENNDNIPMQTRHLERVTEVSGKKRNDTLHCWSVSIIFWST